MGDFWVVAFAAGTISFFVLYVELCNRIIKDVSVEADDDYLNSAEKRSV